MARAEFTADLLIQLYDFEHIEVTSQFKELQLAPPPAVEQRKVDSQMDQRKNLSPSACPEESERGVTLSFPTLPMDSKDCCDFPLITVL